MIQQRRLDQAVTLAAELKRLHPSETARAQQLRSMIDDLVGRWARRKGRLVLVWPSAVVRAARR